MKHIPFLSLKDINSRQHDELLVTMDDVCRSGQYLHGQQTEAFESEFAAYVGTRHCIGVGNGLDALTLIFLAMKQLEHWDDGDEVIVPALTFIATAQAVSRAGLRPVFADVGADFLLDPQQVERLLGKRTRALLPVHLYGRMADMVRLRDLAQANGLKLVEDAAQAHGATLDRWRAGSAGDAAAFSFYPGKNLGALGDGGAVTTDNDALAQRVRMLANYGADRKYYHEYLGLNSRLDELQAALLRRKLPLLDSDNMRRRTIAARYSSGINNPGLVVPYGGDVTASVFHIYPLQTSYRSALQAYLAAAGIGTLIHYPLTVPQQAAYAAYRTLRFPMAENAAAQELSLPISPTLTDEETDYIITTINNFRL